MKYKYIILDFGYVLSYPKSGDWFITDEFIKNIEINKIDREKLKEAIRKYGHILSRKMITYDEEYNSFYEFYKNVFKEVKYDVSDEVLKKISYDFTYSDTKYDYYDDVMKVIPELAKNYKLIILSDNWPCGERIIKNYGLDKYFLKVYISSTYGCVKKEGTFFDYPINDFDINPEEALFIDDKEEILDVAKAKGFNVKIMMRNEVGESKYEIITSLYDLLNEVNG